jgi:hypothetical protein
MNSVNISSVESDWVSLLGSLITVLQETVPSLGWTGHLARSLQAEDQEIEHETVVLEHEGGEL